MTNLSKIELNQCRIELKKLVCKKNKEINEGKKRRKPDLLNCNNNKRGKKL